MSEPGHNSSAEQALWLKHQAIAILDEERRTKLNAEVNQHRKLAKADNIELADLDWTIKVIKWPVGEIALFFKRRLQALSFNNINISAKIDEILGDHSEDQSYAGTLAGMQGKLCSPPANLTPNEKQTWISGWHIGNKERDSAQFDLAEEQKRAATAADALEAKGGAPPVADADSEAGAELGDASYGEEGEGEGDPAAPPPPAADAAPPHQPAKRRAKATA